MTRLELAIYSLGRKYSTTELHPLTTLIIYQNIINKSNIKCYLGGNIGTQSITLMVRGLSTGQVTLNSAFKHIMREALIGLAIGVLFGVLVASVTWSWRSNWYLGVVVGLSMMINMAMATILGTLAPFALKSMKIDPAVASGPVIATTIDVLGLAVYFTLVTFSLKWLL